MKETCLGQIVRAQILTIINDQPLEQNQVPPYRLRVRILGGTLNGKTTNVAYKSVPDFEHEKILIRLDHVRQQTNTSPPKARIESFAQYKGIRIAGYFLTDYIQDDFCTTDSRHVLLLMRIKDWMKGKGAFPNRFSIRCTTPPLDNNAHYFGLISLEKLLKGSNIIGNGRNSNDLYSSISLTHITDSEVTFRYNVPDLCKLASFYNPGFVKWGIHFFGPEGEDINTWELSWKTKPQICKHLNKHTKQLERREMPQALFHYINRMLKFKGKPPPMIISYDESIDFDTRIKPVIKQAEEEYSLRRSITLRSQEKCYD